MRRGTGADLTGILAQRHSAHVVEPVLAGPLRADQAQEWAGGDLEAHARQEGADQVRRLARLGAAAGRHAALQSHHLRGPCPAHLR